MALQRFNIYPIGGYRDSVPANDLSLFTSYQDGFITNDTGGQNYDLRRSRNSCTKCKGYEAKTEANASATRTSGLFNLTIGDPQSLAQRLVMFDSNYVYAALPCGTGVVAFADISPAAGLAFGSDGVNLWSAIDYADYMVFADHGVHTPYKWDGDVTHLSTKLIASGTEYKFRYLETFQNRIFGAYSDQTNGDLEFRWGEPLAALASFTMAAVNAEFVKGTDSITGIKKLGSNVLLVHTENSITAVIPYPYSSLAPFTVVTLLEGLGASSNPSIIGFGDRQYFYNTRYGFIEYLGGTNWKVISTDIETILSGINYYTTAFATFVNYPRIAGTFVPPSSLVWTVTTPTGILLLIYDIKTQKWEVRSGWNFIALASGLCKGVTSGQLKAGTFMMAGMDGKVYIEETSLDAAAGADISAYRIEPIMDFGAPGAIKTISEIWFQIVQGGDYLLDVYWRGGDTVKEVLAASWVALPCLNLNSPDPPCIYPNMPAARLHQIKWGTDLKNERFEVNKISIVYEMQGDV